MFLGFRLALGFFIHAGRGVMLLWTLVSLKNDSSMDVVWTMWVIGSREVSPTTTQQQVLSAGIQGHFSATQ